MQAEAIFWLIATLAMLFIEGATAGLVIIWFAIGSLAALICALLGGQIWLQVAVFFLVAAALLILLRPVVRKHFNPKLQKTNVDAVIDTTGMVTVEINNVMATGTVKIGSMEWTARSTTGDVIPVGSLVKVDKIEGVKVFVTPVQVPEIV